jgi:triacylglycerol esterase/lipase EstA (alpha/beta hydrolase family)
MGNINHIKAYLLGLLVGGGKVDTNTFVIDLPFKKWGMDPKRMNIIATDILTNIRQRFNTAYNFDVTYEIGNSRWLITPIAGADISPLIKDLQDLNLPIGGFLLSTVDLEIAKTKLTGISVESFLSGIFDTRASLTLSHRRFTDDAPVVSVEIPGSTKNFKFVVQLCSWLTDLGSITDQILYNHPNQHAASDPDYKGWKKGFKIRFLVKSFLAQHSFALQAKSIDVTTIEKKQKKEEQIPCYLRKLRKPSPITVHIDQNSSELPIEVRNKIFFHYHHFCAVLNCPHAPKEEIEKLIKHKNSLINFFPRLSKGSKKELQKAFEKIQSTYFPDKKISKKKIKISKLLEDETFVDFAGLDQGIAYLFATSLNGKRHIGSMSKILNRCSENIVWVSTIGSGFNSPLLVVNTSNQRVFICSSVSNKLNQEMIKRKIAVKGLNVNIQ